VKQNLYNVLQFRREVVCVFASPQARDDHPPGDEGPESCAAEPESPTLEQMDQQPKPQPVRFHDHTVVVASELDDRARARELSTSLLQSERSRMQL